MGEFIEEVTRGRSRVIDFLAGDMAISHLMSRRRWLRIGGLAGLATATLGGRVRAGWADRPPGFGRAKSVIVVYANGGQSQLETWDPKPQAPAEVRGEFGSIASAIPGTYVGEHLPKLAKLADRYTIVRSMSHDDVDHGSATYLALTGRYHAQKSGNPDPKPTDFPTLGSILTRSAPIPRPPYTSVHVNGPALVPELPGPGQDAGFLGGEFDPLVIGNVSERPTAFPDLMKDSQLPPVRWDGRRSLLATMDTYRSRLPQDSRMGEMDGLYRQAYELLASPRSRAAFNLEAEPRSVRERYGLHRSGQACLLARRLAEAEVPLITVFWNHSARGQDKHPDDVDTFGWDTHNDIFAVMRDHLLPRFDQSFSALLEDLDARGLLDQTLVICMGEFGRAPRVALESKFAGALPGRKHWANVYSIVMAGAGVSRGATLGESDRFAGYPRGDRYGPWDVTATILWALGIDPESNFFDALARPYPMTHGAPIRGLYA